MDYSMTYVFKKLNQISKEKIKMAPQKNFRI